MKIKSTTLYALLLGCVLLLRGFTLETVDLLDPTETRYATISANMNATGDYLTPMLVSGDAMDTYFSKPPLHYWLTSVSFHLFGVDEWSARLLRFLALLLISACLIVLGRNLVGVEVGLLAALMHASCPLVFYMAGGSHVDMTFAAWITLALTSFILLMELELTRAKRNELSILLAVASAAAFVTKGPLGLILIAGPPAIWMVLTRSRHKLKLLNWPLVILFLVGLGAPWFYLVELKNPGFLEYFFLHENFLRYIKHDYGGRHGANHTKPYGFIWVILAVGVLPFIVPFVLQSVKVLRTRVRALFHADQRLFFFLIWGLLPAAFFTLSSSILPAYLLPGLPGLCLAMAVLIHADQKVFTPGRAQVARDLAPACILLGLTFTGVILDAAWWSIAVSTGMVVAIFLLAQKMSVQRLSDLCARRAVVVSVFLTVAVM
ncbi:MAG: 4-amino-4-deoxy-L-arabinose transferase-like glycosyltransferase, partial [Candidatus Omnitrophota bacterium]